MMIDKMIALMMMKIDKMAMMMMIDKMIALMMGGYSQSLCR
jgi:hypothetical protein